MAAVLRNTAGYTSAHVNKYLQDARDYRQRGIYVPFLITGLSPATLADTYNVCVIPANHRVVDLLAFTPDGLGTSATMALGDAGSAARYMAAASFATAGLQVRTLATTGYGYTPTADTIVVAVNAGAAITVGATFRGHFVLLPPA